MNKLSAVCNEIATSIWLVVLALKVLFVAIVHSMILLWWGMWNNLLRVNCLIKKIKSAKQCLNLRQFYTNCKFYCTDAAGNIAVHDIISHILCVYMHTVAKFAAVYSWVQWYITDILFRSAQSYLSTDFIVECVGCNQLFGVLINIQAVRAVIEFTEISKVYISVH